MQIGMDVIQLSLPVILTPKSVSALSIRLFLSLAFIFLILNAFTSSSHSFSHGKKEDSNH